MIQVDITGSMFSLFSKQGIHGTYVVKGRVGVRVIMGVRDGIRSVIIV